ncbi:unnamed protein product [Rotaria sp. Silwood2]|nr:unnamed protein product [Rotaria sp. Silwood2]
MSNSNESRVYSLSSSCHHRSPSASSGSKKSHKRPRRNSFSSSPTHRSPSVSSKREKSCKRSRRSSSSSCHRSSSEFPRRKRSYERIRRDSISSPSQAKSIKLPPTDGLYEPPAKFRFVQINDQLNKMNASNLPIIISELFQYNIVRGRGLLVRAVIEAQIESPFNTPMYAALVSVINSKIPRIGELVVKRLIPSFHQSYLQNDKSSCLATRIFIAHLINQNVLLDIFAIEMLAHLLKNHSDDSVELAIEFIKECEQKLSQVYPRILDSYFSTLRDLLHESSLDTRILNMIELLFAIRIDQFKANPSIPFGLDLVDEDDQYKHSILLNDPCEPGPMLDMFQYDEQYQENEEKYKQSQRILDETNVNEDESRFSSSTDEEERQDNRIENENQQSIIDQTRRNVLKRTRRMFLTIELHYSADKCTHKLLKMNASTGREVLRCIRLTEEDTTSSSVVYIKYLFLQLVKSLGGLIELINRLTNPTLTEYFQGFFPRDNAKNAQFSINFFESISLHGLTNELRAFLTTNSTSTPPELAQLFIKEKEKEDEDDYENQGHTEALR